MTGVLAVQFGVGLVRKKTGREKWSSSTAMDGEFARELDSWGDHGSNFTLDTVILYIKMYFSSNGILFVSPSFPMLSNLSIYLSIWSHRG
jgi:hypothetical protein